MRPLTLVVGTLLSVSMAHAAAAPPFVNYQGTLRDAAGYPLAGQYDIIFRFFDAPTGGPDVLIDQHTAALGGRVEVTDGLFDVWLFSGYMTDGAGPGTYTTAVDLFTLPAVWMQIEVGNDIHPVEVLTPRVRIVSSAYALSAASLDGSPKSDFLDVTDAPQTKLGALGVQKETYGYPALNVWGGDLAARFTNNFVGGGDVRLAAGAVGVEASGDVGVSGTGAVAAAQFTSSNASGQVSLGYGHAGVYAYGEPAVQGTDNSGVSTGYLGISGAAVAGLTSDMTDSAGYFVNYTQGVAAILASNGGGIRATGITHGGYFDSQSDSAARVWLAGDNFGPPCTSSCYRPTWGIWSEGGYYPVAGNGGGGFFKDVNFSGYAKVGHENYGIQGFGGTMGGYFKDTDSSGEAHVASSDRGIYAFGTFVGGAFSHPNLTSFWANVATPTHKIQGVGAVSFVQNHPHDPDKVIVYSSPEGDEVATYTRGTARLRDGEARVRLGETFALVTNPDLGLTAHLTPHGEAIPLGVASLSTSELIVTGPPGSNADFDFLVYGLRIGYEEAAVVQPKEREAGLPDRKAFEDELGGHAELAAQRPFERFAAMEQESGRASAALPGASAAGTPGAAALRAAIEAAGVNEVGKRKDYGPLMTSATDDPELARARARSDAEPGPVRQRLEEMAPARTRPFPAIAAPARPFAEPKPEDTSARGRLVVSLPAAGTVQASDLVVTDGASDGAVRAATRAFDRAVVGIALGPASGGSADVVVGGVTTLRVDASYGAIRTGDLLCASATPGHAMRSPDAAPGTVVAKALEPLEAGTAVLRVLVMSR